MTTRRHLVICLALAAAAVAFFCWLRTHPIGGNQANEAPSPEVAREESARRADSKQAAAAPAEPTLMKLEFRIVKDGTLTEAPSLRTWLLDCLGEIDRNAAADLAKTILADHTSADEWAISLRDYVLGPQAPEDVAFLQGKMREMIAQADWKQKPSARFLEALDTLVYSHAVSFTPISRNWSATRIIARSSAPLSLRSTASRKRMRRGFLANWRATRRA